MIPDVTLVSWNSTRLRGTKLPPRTALALVPRLIRTLTGGLKWPRLTLFFHLSTWSLGTRLPRTTTGRLDHLTGTPTLSEDHSLPVLSSLRNRR